MVPPLRGRDEVSSSDASYGPHTTLRREASHKPRKKRNKSKKSIRPCTSLVGYLDGDDAGNENGDEIDGDVPPKSFRSRFIAVLRSFLGVPRRFGAFS
jgi:hypothetical protein